MNPILAFAICAALFALIPFTVWLLGLALKSRKITRYGVLGLKFAGWLVLGCTIGALIVHLTFYAFGYSRLDINTLDERNEIAGVIWAVFIPIYILGTIAYIRNRGGSK